MTEFFLHYLWRFKSFETKNLKTLAGESLEILFPGTYNTGGGPDFFNARLRIGSTLWVGHVEIHTRSSDWNRHRHQFDDHYKNVILHVVQTNDVNIFLNVEGDLPVLELKGKYDNSLWETYQRWMKNEGREIICDLQPDQLEKVVWLGWKDRLLVERLEEKSKVIWKLVEDVNGYWPEAFYRRLTANFGFSRNNEAFEMLARTIPLRLLKRYREDLFVLEALLFGQAGWLSRDFEDAYPRRLKVEYQFLCRKHSLTPLPPSIWNFGGVRPSNFPTIRMAQLAFLIHQSENLFAQVLDIQAIEDFYKIFNSQTSEYWRTHFRFDYESTTLKDNVLGKGAIESLLINTVGVMLFAFGRFNQQEHHMRMALRIFEYCKPEDNQITRKWSNRGPGNHSSADSQALVQLYNKYCSCKKCLDCVIGHQLLKPEKINDSSNS